MTTAKHEIDEEQQAFLSTQQNENAVPFPVTVSRASTWHLRLILECAMAIAILALLIRPLPASCEWISPKSPVPKFPRKKYTFVENNHYTHENMFESSNTTHLTLHNWVELSSAARGFVQIPNAESYGLGKPYIVSLNHHTDGPAYMMAVFHQLHCLSYIIDHYQTGFAGINLTKEVAHHSAHCFDYLRQSIMCAADTSLEGETEAGPGWGSDHICTDYDALLAWANKNGAMTWRMNLLPDESNIL